MAALYAFGAHGIMTLNDFKALEGDRQHGVRSLPVVLGPEVAAKIACTVMGLAQLLVICFLLVLGANPGTHWRSPPSGRSDRGHAGAVP
jgi:chlorophyll/bacteriochlorophyll a synthase